MENLLNKVKFGGTVFYCAAKKQLLREDIIAMSTFSGLYQGLKYGGSLKRGIKGGVAVWATVSAINGVISIVENKDKIKKLYEEEFTPKQEGI